MGLPRPPGSPIALPGTDWTAFLGIRQSRATCKDAWLHGGMRVIADEDEVPGSGPGGPLGRAAGVPACRRLARRSSENRLTMALPAGRRHPAPARPAQE